MAVNAPSAQSLKLWPGRSCRPRPMLCPD